MDSYCTPCDEICYSSVNSSDTSFGTFSYAYDSFDYCPYPPSQYVRQEPQPEGPPQLPLHASIPISGYSTLILPNISPSTPPTQVGSTSPTTSLNDPLPPLRGSSSDTNPLDNYANAPQVTFPTPAQLLAYLPARSLNGTGLSDLRPPVRMETVLTTEKTKSGRKHTETRRKAYFRAVADGIGFQVTDPDNITQHAKRRSYLECLEQYVPWLRERIRHAGREPVEFECISLYRGLDSVSFRTLLVHMQDEVRKLHLQTLEDERTFINLQNQVARQSAA
ncbi:hypothetical protein SCP_1502340 [Sparassis crispa]|uniref:Uncharacterized protein n=1 Tax=Sparassis crispa TaxID=139825 RepID=A0A401H461_9APHY|nr:hypothetical protein SCP_1502340 [Sparassis crispa]GBE89226.1 hypothetical protein SCP_1502340 [Sparassis crispa]